MTDSNQLIQLLQGQLSDQLLHQFSNRLGGVDEQKTAMASAGIISTLLSALSRNVAQDDGARSLFHALERDHDGSILDNVMGMLNGSVNPSNPKALNSLGILQHILGNRQSSIVEAISRMSGMNQNQVSNLMMMLAPVVLGVLGRMRQQNNLDANDISSLIRRTNDYQRKQNPQLSLLERLLDRDGDGNIMDDLANIGLKFLGGFLNKR